MIKGLALYYILSMITRNPLLALVLVVIIFAVADKTYLGFLPDVFAPLKRNNRIKSLLAELNLNPANASGAQELGILYFEKRQYGRALKFLSRANERIKDSARLYLYLGMSYMELGEPQKGKESLDQAVKLDKKAGHGLPYIYLLRYELDRKGADSPEAEELEDSLASFANTENFFRMGMLYKKRGYRQKAREMFAKAVDEYSYVPKRMRRIHRKWAILARMHMLGTV